MSHNPALVAEDTPSAPASAASRLRAMSASERLTVRRILKVNHAGEYGAIRIYGAQIAVSQRLWPDVVPALSAMRSHEIEHCRIFREAMLPRQARPCRIMSLWSLGGALLGLLTALLGRQAIWTCTAAVETAVHRHLDDQLHFLRHRDAELHAAILSIRAEELAHLRTAEDQIDRPTLAGQLLRTTISHVTDGLIWLSTWGDSTRMTRELKQAGNAA